MKLTEKIEAIKDELPLASDMGQVKRVQFPNQDIVVDLDLGYQPETRAGDFDIEFERTEYGWEVRSIFQSPI